MKRSITVNSFRDAFRDCGRADSFTYDGFTALYEYLTQLEDECDMEIELDPIAFDCEYTEYSDLEELQGDYPDIESIDGLRDHTQVIEFNHDSLIIAAY